MTVAALNLVRRAEPARRNFEPMFRAVLAAKHVSPASFGDVIGQITTIPATWSITGSDVANVMMFLHQPHIGYSPLRGTEPAGEAVSKIEFVMTAEALWYFKLAAYLFVGGVITWVISRWFEPDKRDEEWKKTLREEERKKGRSPPD